MKSEFYKAVEFLGKRAAVTKGVIDGLASAREV